MNEQWTPEPPAVVVGADGTTTALRALAYAATEARLRHLPLRIVHAAPYATQRSEPGRRRAAAILARAYTVAHQCEPRVPAHTEQLDHQPVAALVRASERAELLVVGMVGERPGEVILGSVALTVSGEAHCPVTVVRGHRSSPSAGQPVLLGVGDVAAAAAAVTVAFTDAERHGTPLVIVHTRHGALRSRITGANREAETTRTLEKGLAPWRSRYPNVQVDLRVVRGAPAEELLQAASHTRLVVVGTNDRGAAARALLGSTSRALLRHSPCPVTVVRRDALHAGDSTQPGPWAAATDPHDRAELW